MANCPRCGMELNPKIAEGNCPNCLMQQAALGTGTEGEPTLDWQPPSIEAIQGSFSQLEVIELVGSGGMRADYKAKQKSLGRLVALKVLSPHYSDNQLEMTENAPTDFNLRDTTHFGWLRHAASNEPS